MSRKRSAGGFRVGRRRVLDHPAGDWAVQYRSKRAARGCAGRADRAVVEAVEMMPRTSGKRRGFMPGDAVDVRPRREPWATR